MPVRVDNADKIQKTLANVYLTLFKEIKKDVNYPNSTILLKGKYNRKVYDSSRKAITAVFEQGHNYVARKLGVETYQSISDVELIKRETDGAVSTFWNRLNADATRESSIRVAQSRLIVTEEPNEFDTTFFLENAALIATTGALAYSTLTKTQQLVDDLELDTGTPVIRWVAMQDEKTCLKLPNGDLGCAFLDGQTWPYDSPDIPTPGRLGPNGTHPNCRCYLSLE